MADARKRGDPDPRVPTRSAGDTPPGTAEEIAGWRAYLEARGGAGEAEIRKLEARLRAAVAELRGSGLSEDEAFMIAVRRLGSIDEGSRAFAREHGAPLWQQSAGMPPTGRLGARTEALVVLALAVGAAAAVKLPALFGIGLGEANALFYARNGPLFILPFLVGYFAWKRGITPRTGVWLLLTYASAVTVANVYPFAVGSDTEILAVLHLPIAVWLAVGIAYAGGRWSVPGVRMGFVRYSGELVIHYAIIAMGGGVLTGLTLLIFSSIGIDAERFAVDWLIPCGMAGAVLVGSWLVEQREGMIENVAPMLARVFTPLFATALLAFLGAMAWTGRPIEVERDVLIAFDLLLVVVVGLLLYNTSARDLRAPPGPFDVLQLVLYASALLVDALALGAIASRITGLGFTPNRIAALGENLLLLVHLAWSTYLYARFLRWGTGFAAVERWQVSYLPVYSAWAALVVIAFPLIFGFG